MGQNYENYESILRMKTSHKQQQRIQIFDIAVTYNAVLTSFNVDKYAEALFTLLKERQNIG